MFLQYWEAFLPRAPASHYHCYYQYMVIIVSMTRVLSGSGAGGSWTTIIHSVFAAYPGLTHVSAHHLCRLMH
ncbi:hypothetical protein E2C01_052801 [Portunus trituberculatus]|uniref:Uncharacterized protein n=1 Tax=Portunus trituberculatus TaxID=210409 RepID=A0A5B7GIM4_PORTR|nr:hypothetical protein [Portunus trituberculatus]